MADRPLFFFTTLAITIGIIFSYSLSAYATLFYGYSEFHFFIRQLIAGMIGITIMWLISKSDPDRLVVKFGFSLFLIFMILMFAMHYLPESMATSAGGAKRWIRLPLFSLSPVEFFKIGFVVFLAWSFSRKFSHFTKLPLKEEIKLCAPYAALFMLVVFLIAVLQNDLGQIFLLGITLAIMMVFAGSSVRLFWLIVLGAFVVATVAIISSDHRILRIKLWWANAQNFILSIFPEQLASSLRVENLPEPYQIHHSLNSIQNGGFFGEGLGNGLIKLGFLSEVHTDIVLAGIAEELGFGGLFLCTLLFCAIVYRIFRIANRSDNNVFYLFCIGCGLLLAFSFMINAYGISGLTPIKGIAVPFFSYGGSSLVANCVMIGMILSISKKARM
ncbi:MAG: FtsW/RodA/SpoVE family cell cycle protein [Wolinella sp.]